MKITLIMNTADQGALQLLRSGVHELRAKGHEVSTHVTFDSGDGARFARNAARQGTDLVIAAGGDGTVNEVVNGLMAGDPVSEHVPRLGIVPLGTANDFSCYLGLPEEPGPALMRAVDGPCFHADVGRVNDRWFVNVSSGGLGAEATEEAPDTVKKVVGPLAYFVTGVRKFASLHPTTATFSSGDNVIYEGPFLFFAVGNGGRTGGGNWVTPQADLADGMLDLCIVQDMGRAELIRLLPLLRNGEHLDHPGVIYTQVTDVAITGYKTISVNLDGEPIHASSLEYSVRPRMLKISGRTAPPIPGTHQKEERSA